MSATRARLVVANVLFDLGVVVLVAGSWLASAWWLLASCLIGGIVLFALAELIAPFPGPVKRHRPGAFVPRR
ncbi:MAG: hypothetical protein ACXWF2_12010 [Usitatibacter sp.]